MAAESSHQHNIETSARLTEEAQLPEPAPREAEGQPQRQSWYRLISEDWLATVVGLILVVLIVVRVFHAIP